MVSRLLALKTETCVFTLSSTYLLIMRMHPIYSVAPVVVDKLMFASHHELSVDGNGECNLKLYEMRVIIP